MHLKFILVAIAFLVFAECTRLEKWESTHKRLYTRNGPPKRSDWTLLKKTDSVTMINFSISLKQQNLDILEQMFWTIANPDSEFYAQHKTREEIMELIAPPKSEQKMVIDWILETALAEQSIARVDVQNFQDVIKVRAPVHVVERLFQTKIFTWLNKRNNQVSFKHFRSLSLPQEIFYLTDMVTGITELPPTHSHFIRDQEREVSLRQVADNQCNTPYTLKKLYNVPGDLVVTNKNANSSIYAEADPGNPEGYGIPSLADFEKANNLPIDPIKCVLGNYVGDYFVNDTDGEAQLDTQMMTGMAAGAQICFYIMNSNNGWMYEFANEIFHTENAPLVVSMSYAWNEVDQCDNATDPNTPDGLGNCTYLHIPDSQTYVARTNVEFKKLGILGHSIVAASGDDGTAGNHGSLNNCETLGPLFPADSPYVTSVGATSIEPSTNSFTNIQIDKGAPPICTNAFYQCNCSTSTNEQPASGSNTAGFDTGGGFSVNNPMPDYQKNAVTAYIKSGVTLPDSSYWNKNNRGYPDIAAVGENFCVLDPDQPCNLAAGTSASAPLIASLITLLNQDRLNAGKNPLGFFNLVIYKMFDTNATKYFNNNFPNGNNGADCGPTLGFNSIAGYWTPLTGVGSPKFDEIRKFVAGLP